jgi:hypothetical protein
MFFMSPNYLKSILLLQALICKYEFMRWVRIHQLESYKMIRLAVDLSLKYQMSKLYRVGKI